MGDDETGRRAVLLLAGGNDAAVPLADGLLRQLGGGRFAIYGAGAAGIVADPPVVRALAEVGGDLRGWRPPPAYPRPPATLDLVITLCFTGCET